MVKEPPSRQFSFSQVCSNWTFGPAVPLCSLSVPKRLWHFKNALCFYFDKLVLYKRSRFEKWLMNKKWPVNVTVDQVKHKQKTTQSFKNMDRSLHYLSQHFIMWEKISRHYGNVIISSRDLKINIYTGQVFSDAVTGYI